MGQEMWHKGAFQIIFCANSGSWILNRMWNPEQVWERVAPDRQCLAGMGRAVGQEHLRLPMENPPLVDWAPSHTQEPPTGN